MHEKKRIFFMMILVLSFVLYGCVVSQTPGPSMTQVTPSSLATASENPSPTLILNSTKILATKVPPPAPAGLPPTWTPLPTYPADQARQVVIGLYEKNPCKLPCWWGITPGKTSWLEAWQFLGRFATNRYPWDNLLLESKGLPGYMYYRVHLDLPQTPEVKSHFLEDYLSFIINIKTFDVDYIDVYTGNVEAYTLSRIFTDYGKPKQIYARGGESPIASAATLYFYYPQFGFISSYGIDVERAVWKKPTFNACFQKSYTNLWLWPQEQQLEFYDRMKMSTADANLIKPLDKVSDSDVDKLFHDFIEPQKQPCIEFNTSALADSP